MPLPTNTSRPNLPYTPDQSLPNNSRFDLLGRRPPTAEMFDAELNALTDDVNRLAAAINEVEAGNIPGSDNPLNANKVIKTDGDGHLSFSLIHSHQLAAGAVVEAALAVQSVTTTKLGDGAVSQDKMAADSVATVNLVDGAVVSAKIADGAVTTDKIAEGAITADGLAENSVLGPSIATNAITGPKIANQTITPDKLNVEDFGGSPGEVVTVLSDGKSCGFEDIPFTGRIIQLKAALLKTQSSVTGATDFKEFSSPFRVSITTQKPRSTLLVFLSANLVSGYSQNSHINYPQTLFYALFKNGVLWDNASGTKGTNQTSGLGQIHCFDYQDVRNISALCSEVVPARGTTNTYSLRALCGADYYVMMNSQLPDDAYRNYSGVAGISSLYVLEIGG